MRPERAKLAGGNPRPLHVCNLVFQALLVYFFPVYLHVAWRVYTYANLIALDMQY